jgi:uncharacterized protein (TIGR01777 family)
MDVVVTGSSGLIGTALVAALTRAGHRPVRLVRRAAGGADEITWDPKAGTVDTASLEGIGGVVHLAGAGIGDHRWTDAYKRELVESRTGPTSLLARSLAGLDRRPGVLLSGSAIGWYGSRGDEVLTETSARGTGFLPDLCRDWEAATAPASEAGIRVAHLRTGIVLSAEGGALAKQLPLFKFGLGGRMGSGRQWMSWVSIEDEIGAIIHLLGTDVSGPVNITAPNPVTNAEFTTTLGAALKRPTIFPIPSFGPKLLLGGELAESLLFTGARITPAALTATGFAFRHAVLADAFAALLGRARAA